MATISSNSWTGRAFNIFGDSDLKERPAAKQEVNTSTPYVPPKAEVPAPAPTPEPVYVPKKYEPVGVELAAYSPDQLREYSEVAELVGVAPADLVVEEFKGFIIAAGVTVFSLATVVAFMDEKAKAEGRGNGWNWRPLRAKDAIAVSFGTAARRDDDVFGSRGSFQGLAQDMTNAQIQQMINRQTAQRSSVVTPASDHYSQQNGVYGQVVPLHALKKVAMIEKGFKHPVSFVVSDYAPAPAFKVDPFLMVMIPNNALAGGVGRYVIDVWDEPGFGIEQMLKSDL